MGGGPSVVAKLSSSDARKQSIAVDEVLAMTDEGYKRSSSQRALLVAAGASLPLVDILRRSGDPEAVAGAALALGNLTSDAYAHRVAVAAAGAVPPLVALLHAEAAAQAGPPRAVAAAEKGALVEGACLKVCVRATRW